LDGVTARSNSSWLKKSVSLVGGRRVAQPDSTASTNMLAKQKTGWMGTDRFTFDSPTANRKDSRPVINGKTMP
jgi:hypothetical protein